MEAALAAMPMTGPVAAEQQATVVKAAIEAVTAMAAEHLAEIIILQHTELALAAA